MEDFYPLETVSKYKVTLEAIGDDICKCSHPGNMHFSTGERCCMVTECNCFKYRRFDKDLVTDIDKAMIYFHEQKDWNSRVSWIFENLKWFRNYNNTDLVLAWWIFILKYNPFEEFMTPQVYKTISYYGKPESITRAARKLREDCKKNLHPNCKYCEFDPDLVEAKIEKEYGIYQFFHDNKS